MSSRDNAFNWSIRGMAFVKSAALARVEELIFKAADEALPTEERKTAALEACCLQSRMRICLQRPFAADKQPREIAARFASRCLLCRDSYAIGARVMWSPGTSGAVHAACYAAKVKAA